MLVQHRAEEPALLFQCLPGVLQGQPVRVFLDCGRRRGQRLALGIDDDNAGIAASQPDMYVIVTDVLRDEEGLQRLAMPALHRPFDLAEVGVARIGSEVGQPDLYRFTLVVCTLGTILAGSLIERFQLQVALLAGGFRLLGRQGKQTQCLERSLSVLVVADRKLILCYNRLILICLD